MSKNRMMVHIKNTSGSALEIATVALLMEKDTISSASFPLEDLDASNEIQKFKQLHFIQLLSPDEANVARAKAAIAQVEEQQRTIADDVLDTIEQTKDMQAAFLKVEKALSDLKSLLSGRKITTSKPTAPPKPEAMVSTEGAGEQAESTGSVEQTVTASKEADDDEVIPDNPPLGMKPVNDPAKKFIGVEPYEQPLSYQEKLKFLSQCSDIGIVREIAIFEKPGRVKELAKKKLRECKAVASY